jgi:hypothetical protein
MMRLVAQEGAQDVGRTTTMRYTLTVDLIGSTVTVTFTADSPTEAIALAAEAYPEARSINLEGAAPVAVSV